MDDAGEVVAEYEHFPFGELKSASSCGELEGVYQGALRDQKADLYDLGARHHSPDLVRFLTADVVWPDLRVPSRWNLYLYSTNDPVNLIDLLGYATTTKNGGINYLRNIDLYDDPRGYQMLLEVAANFTGETVSDLLSLDVIADGMALAGDSTLSPGQRAWGTTKAGAVAVMDVVGGVIVKRFLGRAWKAWKLWRRGEELAEGAIRGGARAVSRTTGLADDAARGGVRTTAHGAERIAGQGATRGGVLSEAGIDAVRQGGRVMTQADGATVRILQNEAGRFNVVVEGERGIITTFENLSQKSLDRLGKNYGWQ
ncbi:MAG TPA: hypothetical protein ENK43_13415 [Planctomycetes bacterium]|nr:hypothetical protein [Planctomycetota bacterium]